MFFPPSRCLLLPTPEQSGIYRLTSNVACHRLENSRASFNTRANSGHLRSRLNVERCIECEKFKHVMMWRSSRRCSRTSVIWTAHADLPHATGQLCSLRNRFGKTVHACGNPEQPMQDVLGS